MYNRLYIALIGFLHKISNVAPQISLKKTNYSSEINRHFDSIIPDEILIKQLAIIYLVLVEKKLYLEITVIKIITIMPLVFSDKIFTKSAITFQRS